MSENRESKLKSYSLGIVAVTKDRESDEIEVTPIEELPMEQGNLSEKNRVYDVNVPDAKGVSRNQSLTGGSTIKATWLLKGNSNRFSSPDVVKGETVEIFRFADTDEYYWAQLFREPALRRLEQVMYAWSNLPSGINKFDRSTSYWAEVDTVNKFIQLHTSKNDGEPFGYDATINAQIGQVQLKDDAGNEVLLDSANNIYRITTIAGAVLEFNNGNTSIVSKDGCQMTMEDGTTHMQDSTGAGITIQGGVMTLKAAQIVLDTPSMSSSNSQGGGADVKFEAQTLEIAAGATSISGSSVKIHGDGDVTLTGGSITANGENLSVDNT